MSDVFSLAFFFTAADFHLALVTVSISHFLTTATKFSSSLFVVFIYLSLLRFLSIFFSLSFAGLPPAFSFSLSFACSIPNL